MSWKSLGVFFLCFLAGCQTTKPSASIQGAEAFEDIKIYDAHLSLDGEDIFFTAKSGPAGVSLFRYEISNRRLERIAIPTDYAIHTALMLED